MGSLGMDTTAFPPAPRERQAMKTLFADDSPTARAIIGQMLRGRGHDPVIAEDGRQAWDFLRREPFELVITDLVMPEVDGLELCRRLRAQPDGDRPVVLVVT